MKSKIFLSAALIILQISTNLPWKKYLPEMRANFIGDTVTFVVIFKSDTSKFHDVESLGGKVVEVTGKVK